MRWAARDRLVLCGRLPLGLCENHHRRGLHVEADSAGFDLTDQDCGLAASGELIDEAAGAGSAPPPPWIVPITRSPRTPCTAAMTSLK